MKPNVNYLSRVVSAQMKSNERVPLTGGGNLTSKPIISSTKQIYTCRVLGVICITILRLGQSLLKFG